MGTKHPYTAEKLSEMCNFANKLKFRPIIVTWSQEKERNGQLALIQYVFLLWLKAEWC